MRRLLLILLIAALASPGLWWRTERPERDYDFDLSFRPLAKAQDVPELGPFRFEGAWEMVNGHVAFGGLSAMLALPDGRLAAFSDTGYVTLFSPPGDKHGVTAFAAVFGREVDPKKQRDVEAATLGPYARTVWTAQEYANSVARHRLEDGKMTMQAMRSPDELRDWGDNSGPESLERLPDGSFVALREGFGWFSDAERRPAVRWQGDPLDPETESEAFIVRGPSRYSPVDMAALPDGRALVLYRRVVWPIPPRFRAKLAIGDPDEIRAGKEWRLREVASLPARLPLDNFEGMAVREAGGRVEVWIVSDDNRGALQRTLLWKLTVDPKDLPGATGTRAPEQAANRSEPASD